MIVKCENILHPFNKITHPPKVIVWVDYPKNVWRDATDYINNIWRLSTVYIDIIYVVLKSKVLYYFFRLG